MSWIDGLRHRMRILLARDAYDRELQAERAFHLSLEQMHQESDGAAVPHAASVARRRYGNVTVHEEHIRRLTPLAFLEQVARDARYTMRQLWRAPVFSFGVIGTFALGIGANAAMFDVLDRLLLRAPAFLASPNETHRIFTAGGRDAEPFGGTNYRRFRDLSTGTSSFDVTAAFWSGNVAVGSGVC